MSDVESAEAFASRLELIATSHGTIGNLEVLTKMVEQRDAAIRAEQSERIAELEAALKPFAVGCIVRDDGNVNFDAPPDPECCRYCAARAALERKP